MRTVPGRGFASRPKPALLPSALRMLVSRHVDRIRLTSRNCALVLAVCVVCAAIRAHAQTPTKGAPARSASTSRPSPAASATGALTPAWRAFYSGDLDRAAMLAKAAVTANERDAGARLVLARVAIQRGD